MKDTGCNLAPACLTCHLPKCKYDMPKRDTLEAEAAKLRNEGRTVVWISRRLGVGERTLYRMLKR